jgi:S1-C subfamily serine protease
MISERTKRLYHNILYPTVMVGTKKANGSGVVISSKKKKNQHEIYILTNYHVISSSIESKSIKVTFFRYGNWCTVEEEVIKDVEIIGYNKKLDLALLRLYLDVSHPCVCFYSGKLKDIHIFNKVYACGCSLGYSPIVTSGYVSRVNEQEDNRWIVTPSVADGSSGSGVYLTKNNQLVGIVCETGATEKNIDVNHICFIIPINIIRRFLKKYLKKEL